MGLDKRFNYDNMEQTDQIVKQKQGMDCLNDRIGDVRAYRTLK